MGIFTTNWYLYKTHMHPVFTKTERRNSEAPTEDHLSRKKIQIRKSELERTMKFEQILAEAIDEGLALLGESPKEAIYSHIEKTFKINREDIPYRIDEFTDVLERIFGDGAKILKIQIMKCLFKKVGHSFKHYKSPPNLDFTEYVEAAKLAQKNYENKEQQPNSDTPN